MSILIKGMEMPTSCRDCLFEDQYDGYNCRINETSYNWGIDSRPSDCPLVHVPPHGRLIDADALNKKVGLPQFYEVNYVSQLDIVDAPTIIEAEEGE